MTEYAVVDATEAHVKEVADYMRQADRDEVYATNHHKPHTALRISVNCTPEPKAGTVDGRAMCIFGIGQSSLLSNDGSPWLLGHEELPKHARAFLRMSFGWMKEERLKYSKLVNYVDARNVHSIKWIRWLGFELEAAKPFGIDKVPFHRFSWVRPEEEHV
jgi:hypothetical protein